MGGKGVPGGHWLNNRREGGTGPLAEQQEGRGWGALAEQQEGRGYQGATG